MFTPLGVEIGVALQMRRRLSHRLHRKTNTGSTGGDGGKASSTTGGGADNQTVTGEAVKSFSK
jgi:hypothetical protein